MAKSIIGLILAILWGSAAVQAQEPEGKLLQNWHQWRGPLATGANPQADPPTTWSETENIRWKVPIAGRGISTPIIWEDKLFLLTSIDTGKVDTSLPKPEDQPERPFGITYPNTFYQYVVLCLDRNTGRELWRQVATERVPNEGHHGDNNYASSSPTTDGKRLYAWFGSAGLFCYDLSGKLLWQREFGDVNTRLSFGEGCSPVVANERVIINRDNEDQSKIYVLNAADGSTLWQADRDEPSAWATPLVVEHEGVTQVITNASNRVRSYDLKDGSILWECGGQVGNVIPSPVTDGQLVYCMSGYRGNAVFALPLSARGDITQSDQIVWSKNRDTPYVPSPLLYKGTLYYNKTNDPILTSVDASTGDIVIPTTRLPEIRGVYASPVAAADRIYFVGRNGVTLVLAHGKEFNVLATNTLDEPIDASPAIVGDTLFLRGSKSLYCIGE